MTISTTITVALASLEAQVLAAEPLANASHATITALQLNAGNLVTNIQTAITIGRTAPTLVGTTALTTTGLLDAWIPPIDAATIITGVLSVLSAAKDQSKLSLMRGVVGRATSNLNQLV